LLIPYCGSEYRYLACRRVVRTNMFVAAFDICDYYCCITCGTSGVQRFGDARGQLRLLDSMTQDSGITPITEKYTKGGRLKYVKTDEINALFELNINQPH